MNPLAKCLLFAMLALSPLTLNGKGKISVADSLSIERYIEKIVIHLKEPVVLKMTDTLFTLAEKAGDTRRQTLSLAYKLDYYYYLHQEDSLMIWVGNVMNFAEKHNQPIYYYFSWQRVITNHIRNNRINAALSETEKMQKYAIDHNYFPGQIDALRMMGRIYFNRNLYNESANSFIKAISIAEQAPPDVEIVNRHSLYMNTAQALVFAHEYEMVPSYLNEGLALCTTEYQKGPIYSVYCSYYLNKEDVTKAKECLNKVEELNSQRINIGSTLTIQRNKTSLAILEKEYDYALSLLDTMYIDFPYDNFYYKSRYLAYKGLGKPIEANRALNKWIAVSDSTRIANIKTNIGESMAMMDINRQKSEAQKVEIQQRESWLAHLYVISAILLALVIWLVFVLKKAFRINNRLKENEKNLSEAIVKMEEVSQVKRLFLQQLSHEIRTPLNAIVGFSYIISESAREGKRNTDISDRYSKAITEESQELIKIVNQALQ